MNKIQADSNELVIDQWLLDELVTGDLQGEQYRAVLAALEAQPEKWRDCALAFLQEQALERDLQALAGSESTRPWSTSDTIEMHVPSGMLDTVIDQPAVVQALDEHEQDQSAHTTAERRRAETSFSRLQWMHRVTSIAALLLISFTVGWFGSGLWEDGSAQVDTAPDNGSLATTTGTNANPGAAHQPRTDLPSVDGSVTAPPQTQFAGLQKLQDGSYVTVQPNMPDWLKVMERRGDVRVERSEIMWVPVDLEDGRSVVVPAQEYRIRPGKISY